MATEITGLEIFYRKAAPENGPPCTVSGRALAEQPDDASQKNYNERLVGRQVP
jgi:hypothetical protein